MTGFAAAPVHMAGRPPMELNERPISLIQEITPGYLGTLKIALKRGREFTAHNNAKAMPVATLCHLSGVRD